MSRAGARQIHCEAAVPCVECDTAVLNCKCLAILATFALAAEQFLLACIGCVRVGDIA